MAGAAASGVVPALGALHSLDWQSMTPTVMKAAT